jgi:hypothetical protein
MAGAVSALAASACCRPAAHEIYSVPRVACPGQAFLLKWRTHGKGVISACPTPRKWINLVVEDSGEQSLAIHAATTFTLTVPDAEPRDQSKSAEVLLLTSSPDRSVEVQCDVPGKVYGIFSLVDVADGVRVRQIHHPYATTDGKRADREVCISHLGETRCVAPGQSIPNSPAVDCANGPSKLGIQLDFECS